MCITGYGAACIAKNHTHKMKNKRRIKMKAEVKKTFDIEKPRFGQSISTNVKYADKQTFEHAKKQVLREFDQQLRSLSKR